VRPRKKPPDTDQKPDDQPKLVASLKASLTVPGSQHIPKEKETQDQTISTQQVLVYGDAGAHLDASPLVILRSQVRIIFYEEDGNRDNHIGAPFHQTYQPFLGIRFGKDDEHHYRVPKNFDPSLKSHEGKIRPGDGNKTVEQKSDEPTIVKNNF
jgi:hypothetical protein